MPHQKPVQGSHQGEDTPAIASKTSVTSKNFSKNTQLESTTFQFGYREFEGENGKHLLRELVKHILSSAECDLWEAIIEFQRKFPQAYVGVKVLAKFMNRCHRTVSNGLKALHERGLLILQQDWIFRQNEDESYQCRLVTLKLFQPLYDLAFRFLQWRNSPAYVPPTWEYAEFILNHKEILDQVRDFACYQRLFKKKPGPKRHQSQGQELRPAIRCSNFQCSYCYQNMVALESEIRVLGLKLVNAEDMLKCDKDKIRALWNKYLQGYSPYSIDTRVYNSLISNSKLDFLQKWLKVFLREEEQLRQRYSCEHCRHMALSQGLLCGQHSRDEQHFSSPAFGEIGPEQASEREASVQAEEAGVEASVQVLCPGDEEPQTLYSDCEKEQVSYSVCEEVPPEPVYWPESLIEAFPEAAEARVESHACKGRNTFQSREWGYRPNLQAAYPRTPRVIDAMKQPLAPAQVAVLAGGGNDWQTSYQPLAQGPLTHEELARRKAEGRKARPAGKKEAKQYPPQRLPGIEEQKRMQPRQPLTRRLMLLGYSVSEKFRDANPYSTQSCLVNHMQRLLHFAAEAGLEDHASVVEDWFYRTIEHYRDAAYALAGVRSQTDQGQIKRMPWFVTALNNAVIEACKALSRGEPLPEPTTQVEDEEVDEEATRPILEPYEEDSTQPAEPAEISTRIPDEQSSALHEVSGDSYSHEMPEECVEAMAENVGSVLAWTLSEAIAPEAAPKPGDAGVHASMDPTHWVNAPGDEGLQASVAAVEEPQPVVNPLPIPTRLKVRRRLRRLGVQEEIEVNVTCPKCDGHFAYTEPRDDGGKDYYCCLCAPSPYWSDNLYACVHEILTLPVEELKRLNWH